MKSLLKAALCLITLLGSVAGHAYTPVTRPELSNLCVRDIEQDSYGYIWIATANGLCRSYGSEYQIFFGESGAKQDLHTIPASSVSDIYTDKDGWLLVATHAGICALEKDTKIFHRFSPDGNGSYSFTAYGFIEYAGRLLCFGEGGLYEIDKDSHRLTLRVKMEGEPVSSAVKGPDGKLWIANGTCLMAIDPRLSPTVHMNFDASKRIKTLGVTDRLLLLGTPNGLTALNPSDRTLLPTSIGAGTEVNHILNMRDGTIIVATGNRGVLAYTPKTEQVSQKYRNIDFSEAGTTEINRVFCDRDNNFWLATFDKGEKLLTDRHGIFNSDRNLINAFRGEFVTRITPAPDGRLWAGTRYRGLVTVDAAGRKTYLNRSTSPALSSFSHDFVQEMKFDSSGRLWVGYNNTLMVFNPVSSLAPSLSVAKQFPFFVNVVSMAEDRKGNMWVGTDDSGLFVIDRALNVVKTISTPLLRSNNITRIIPYDLDNMLVSAYSDNLYLIDIENMSLRNFEPSHPLAWSNAIDILLDRHKNLWVGTYNHGLFRLDAKTRRLSPCIENQALDIVGLAQDAKGNIWASSSYGIYHFDRSGKLLDSFLKSDGLGGNQFHEKCVSYLPGGRILFGGNSGIEQIKPLTEPAAASKPIPVMLRGLWMLPDLSPALSGRKADLAEAAVKEITLSHNDNSINIDYFAVSYDRSADVDYAYMLQGRDKDFIYSGSHSNTSYSDLSSGTYPFYVKVRKKGGEWQEPVKLLTVTVKPNPWLSIPALIIYFIIFIAAIVIINRNYLRIRLIKQKYALSEERIEQEKRITDNRINFFTNISHELRTPLTLICGPAKYLRAYHQTMTDEQVKESLDFIDSNINRLLTLINQLLSFRRVNNETLPLKVAKADMGAQLASLSKLYTFYASENRIKVNLDLPADQPLTLTYDTDKIEKIVSNLMVNAIKYSGQEGSITISLTLTGKPDEIEGHNTYKYAQLSVSDTGRGIKEEDIPTIFKPFKRLLGLEEQKKTEGFGIGLHFVSHLVKEHKGVLRTAKNPDGGMTFTIIIPVSEEAFAPIEFRTGSEITDVDTDFLPPFTPKPSPAAPAAEEKNPDLDPEAETETDADADGEQDQEEATPKILIVDDNTSLNDFVAGMFRDRFTVIQAYNGTEAYEKAVSDYPDIIISDVLMDGDTDGFNLCRRIKADSSTSHIPVILLTAKTLDEHRVEGYNCGADAYLCKPFSPEVLIARVNNLCAKRSQNASLILASAGVSDSGTDHPANPDELSPLDKKFLSKLYAYIDESLDNCDLNVNMLGRELGFSRTNFYRKVKALTGISPNDLLRVYRLNRAAELLLTREYTVGEVGERTGFANQSHFSSLFKKHFGVSPRAYVTNHFTQPSA